MSSLSNILNFIKISNTTKGALERKCHLPNATFQKKIDLDADLTSDIVDKISQSAGNELLEAGFHIVDVSPFDKPIWVILNSDELKKYRQSYNAEDEKARRIGRAEEGRDFSIEASLTSLLEGQNEIRAQIQTIHQWDAEVYAAGDDAKGEEAAAHIGMLYAANLREYQRRGIRPLVGRHDKIFP